MLRSHASAFSGASVRATVLVLIAASIAILAPPLHAAVPFQTGDVIAAIGNGKYNHLSPTGTLLETLDSTQGGFNTTGMCFDPAGNMYGTNFSANSMSKFSNTGVLLGPFGTFNANPESCLITAGGTIMYVSEVFGTGDILKLNVPSGTQAANYNVPRSDWIDLAADLCTMFYSDEGPSIHRFNVCTNTALPDFTSAGPAFYALRILPNGDVLAAAQGSVKRFNSAGTEILPAYTASGETFFFALNLDPDGTHFWSGGITTGTLYKFNLTPVGPPVLSFSSQIGAGGGAQLAGVAVVGETIVSNPTPTPTTVVATPTSTPSPGQRVLVPTLSTSMLALLGLVLAATAVLLLRRL